MMQSMSTEANIKRIHFERFVDDIKYPVKNTPETISNVANQLYRDIEITLE